MSSRKPERIEVEDGIYILRAADSSKKARDEARLQIKSILADVRAHQLVKDETPQMKLYEVLVPTIYGDTMKPIRTRHHKRWDDRVKTITGGLTILSPGKGVWVYEGKDYLERVIPVRIFCSDDAIKKIVQITLQHYRQKAVMYYVVSNECYIVNAAQ